MGGEGPWFLFYAIGDSALFWGTLLLTDSVSFMAKDFKSFLFEIGGT